MREILFRGKSVDSNYFTYGYLIKLGNRYGITDKCISILDGVYHNFEVREVIPETIGQYTGMIDSNNNKIFEGDIISIPFEEDRSPYESPVFHHENGVIYFDDSRHGWYVRFTDSDEISIWEFDDRDVLVIGNIHDNPELLKWE